MRMTISLTIIMIESMWQISYGILILIAVAIAKWVGDLFNKGIYEIQIELKKTPFLEWESPNQMESWQVLECDGQSAHHPGLRDVRPSASPPDERTSLLASGGTKKHSYSLTFEKHHGNLSGNYDNWVQVTTKKPIALCGIILRSQLITLLKRKVFFDEKSAVVPDTQPYLTHEDMNADYTRFGSISDVHLDPAQKEMLMDVTLYMNPSALTPYLTWPPFPKCSICSVQWGYVTCLWSPLPQER
ncbi:hypothetical protein EMCRGX_G026922 [Ephydatia muelleri]